MNKPDKQPKELRDALVREIGELIDSSKRAFIRCGKRLAEYIDINPSGKEELAKLIGCREAFLWRLEQVGRGRMDPSLLLDDSPGAMRAMRLPIEQQKIAVNQPLKVTRLYKGKNEIYEKPLAELSKSEVDLVIAKDHIRTPEEQGKILRTVYQPHDGAKPAERYVILEDGTVIIQAHTQLTAAQIEDVANRAKAKSIAWLGNHGAPARRIFDSGFQS